MLVNYILTQLLPEEFELFEDAEPALDDAPDDEPAEDYDGEDLAEECGVPAEDCGDADADADADAADGVEGELVDAAALADF